ncbi:Frataxin [Suillus subalutaceus]|uniref:Frataxin n=1 Tax=Suillus subalutaceus TaxID=48586 RepID=UPI001B85B3FB|nr:Frataxin [Suillus subalutaceus]KAG1845508.1 Frataxin [Suillus subalutaceus]
MLPRNLLQRIPKSTSLHWQNAAANRMSSLIRHVTLTTRAPLATRLYVCRRTLSTPAPMVNVSDLSIGRYHTLADATMTTLLERLEDLLDTVGNGAYEVDYHSGVLTLNLGTHGTYVINKQPPNKQIWLSSPLSGPKRYDYVPESDDWRYVRDGMGLGELLDGEITDMLQTKVSLHLEGVSAQIQE